MCVCLKEKNYIEKYKFTEKISKNIKLLSSTGSDRLAVLVCKKYNYTSYYQFFNKIKAFTIV